MSDEIVKSYLPSGPDEQTIDVIKEEAIVSIKMSTGFYKRVQQIIGFVMEGKKIPDIQDAHRAIAERKVNEPWVYHYETLLILCREFEKEAQEGGFVEQMTIAEARQAMEEAEKRAEENQ